MDVRPSVIETPSRERSGDSLIDLRAASGPSHFVQFFESDDPLAESVSVFAGAGLGSGQPAIVVATAAHRVAIEERLQSNGFDLQALVERGQYLSLDADDTLAKISVDGLPDAGLFEEHVAQVVERMTAKGLQPRLFGEMVAILHREGRSEAALRLEHLWNELSARSRFSLLCAYPLRDFTTAGSSEFFGQVCGAHTHVIPGESYINSPTQEDHLRTIAQLQQRSLALEAEMEVRKRVESELASFVETAQVGMHRVGADGIIQWANPAEMSLLGYSPEEYVGHHVAEFHVDAEVIKDILERLARDERLSEYEARMKCKDGTIKTVHISSSGLWSNGEFLHSQCITRDVTEDLLRAQAMNRLAAIVRSSDDAIISKDLNGVITSWNKGAERIFGYAEQEAIGKPVLMLIPEGRHNEEPAILKQIRLGNMVDHYETVRKRKDGALIDISVTISPLRDAKGKIVGASKIARDVTQQKQTREKLQILAEELGRAKEELEERVNERTASLKAAMIQMEEFSYTVSHDLRAPLRAMALYAQVLLEDYAPIFAGHDEARHHLLRISENCKRLDRMIQDVLTFGRVTRDGLTLEPVSLDRVLSDLIQDYPSLQPASARIKIEPLGEVIGHEPSIAQVLSNLLTNAVKFVPPDRAPDVRVYGERHDGHLRLSVQDNGIGIDPKWQHRLFGLFERIHPELGYEGTGVGLAIVRKATERMGGRVGMDSDGKNGSCFWIELPVASSGEANE